MQRSNQIYEENLFLFLESRGLSGLLEDEVHDYCRSSSNAVYIEYILCTNDLFSGPQLKEVIMI